MGQLYTKKELIAKLAYHTGWLISYTLLAPGKGGSLWFFFCNVVGKPKDFTIVFDKYERCRRLILRCLLTEFRVFRIVHLNIYNF